MSELRTILFFNNTLVTQMQQKKGRGVAQNHRVRILDLDLARVSHSMLWELEYRKMCNSETLPFQSARTN